MYWWLTVQLALFTKWTTMSSLKVLESPKGRTTAKEHLTTWPLAETWKRLCRVVSSYLHTPMLHNSLKTCGKFLRPKDHEGSRSLSGRGLRWRFGPKLLRPRESLRPAWVGRHATQNGLRLLQPRAPRARVRHGSRAAAGLQKRSPNNEKRAGRANQKKYIWGTIGV